MAVTLVSTPGAANANSYLTVAEAQAYFDTRTAVAGWDDADDQSVLLMMATRVMDAMLRAHVSYNPDTGNYTTGRAWTGAAATTTQKLAWPRTGMYDANGNVIDDDVIPQDLKDAVAELAGALGTADTTVDNDVAVQGITSVKAGSVSLTFKDMIERHVMPDMVWNLLVPSWYTEEVVIAAVLQDALFDVVSE